VPFLVLSLKDKANINGPLLPLARPNTLRVEIDGPLALQRFLDWYEGGKVA
jgi:hypothetical protein